MRKMYVLGTGFAMATKCFNTCFYLEAEDGSLFLTDAGGGNGILRQLEQTPFKVWAALKAASTSPASKAF